MKRLLIFLLILGTSQLSYSIKPGNYGCLGGRFFENPILKGFRLLARLANINSENSSQNPNVSTNTKNDTNLKVFAPGCCDTQALFRSMSQLKSHFNNLKKLMNRIGDKNLNELMPNNFDDFTVDTANKILWKLVRVGHMRTKEEMIEIVDIFVQFGVDLNQQDNDGVSPVLAALWLKKDTVACVLLERGADINAASNNGSNAFSESIRELDFKRAEEIIKLGNKCNQKVDVDSKIVLQYDTKNPQEPIFFLIRQLHKERGRWFFNDGYKEIFTGIDFLVENGVDLNAVHTEQFTDELWQVTALDFAIEVKLPEIVIKKLTELGAKRRSEL